MGFRQFVKPRSTELSGAQSATLATAPVQVPTIQPTKSNGLNIVGMKLSITATVTQSAAANWTVGSLIKELRFMRGSSVLLDINGEDQLEKVFHIYTGMPIGATFNSDSPTYFSNPTNAGAAGQSTETETVYLPLHFLGSGLPLQVILNANAYTVVSNATAGSITFQVTFTYSDLSIADDTMKIVVAPTALNASTDINISTQFSENKPVDEVWVELTADSSLNYQSYSVGQTVLYDQVDPTTLSVEEAPVPTFSHIAGFLKQMIKRGTVFPTQGATQNAPKLINNYSANQTPTFYLVLTPAGPGVSASAASSAGGGA
ncbi:MAG: hypothetical protein JRN62_10075 [Nitrososphaerota archaeon]|jgi:hypothetical protein|nr:hypothetical protein [Nitrososphaerota archaeon]MDG6949811.1 hypothetical protein [Nitrososphaerota archaeon]